MQHIVHKISDINMYHRVRKVLHVRDHEDVHTFTKKIDQKPASQWTISTMMECDVIIDKMVMIVQGVLNVHRFLHMEPGGDNKDKK